jgi:flagellar hook capping protein FlgD
VQQDIYQHYQTTNPGEVVVIGADLFNCAQSGLGGFKQNTGATYPLLLLASVNTGGNIQTLYGERDHYVVINKQGIVRYQANDRWPYGDGYHLDEIRGCVDSLVTPVNVGVDGAPGAEFALRAAPIPSGSTVAIVLSNPTGRTAAARVTVHDLAGRRVATLLDGPAAPGATTLKWNGRDRDGRAAASGVYQVRAEIAGRMLARRIALVR